MRRPVLMAHPQIWDWCGAVCSRRLSNPPQPSPTSFLRPANHDNHPQHSPILDQVLALPEIDAVIMALPLDVCNPSLSFARRCEPWKARAERKKPTMAPTLEQAQSLLADYPKRLRRPGI
mmetsp:Transcript_1104/g.2212  ORF Transcript_1104/g.2212 Transcript_1104/m.2212 type:complete len:120 (+) Transcript_1104:124-483(+)